MSDMWTAYGVWAAVGQNYRAQKSGKRKQQYDDGWRRGQIALVTELRAERISVLKSIEFLSQQHPTPTPYHSGWFDGQRDLIAALQQGSITLKAAALNLGMIAPGEE